MYIIHIERRERKRERERELCQENLALMARGLQGPRTPVASELEHIKCRVGNRVEGHLYQANNSSLSSNTLEV